MARKKNDTSGNRRGWLKNGNLPGDFSKAPRCGATTRKGVPCQSPAMPNGRCWMHGGKSTGPRTRDGLERSRKARWKHGYYSAKAIAERKEIREILEESKELLVMFN
jgi:hypothetical protein